MALIRVSNHFIDDEEMFEVLLSAFDTIERVKTEYQITVFKVSGEEIPKGDVFIEPLFYKFEGVRPFIIEWN